MADLIASPIIQNLLAYLKDQYELQSDVKEKLKKLDVALNQIQAVVKRADDVEMEKNEVEKEKNKHLAKWLRELKDAAFEAEDVLDEFGYRALKKKVADEDNGSGRDNAKSIKQEIISCCCYFLSLCKNLKSFIESRESLKNLRGIQKKFEELAARTGEFSNLVREMGDGPRGQTVETSSFKREPELVGRMEESDKIINLLLVVGGDGSSSSSSGGQGVPVIPLVGQGGFGKTTLARHVFNDPRVEKHFEARMWVHVSQNFDVKRLTRAMIETASEKKCDVESLEGLQQALKKAVGQKRFLLALDDVWFVDYTSETEEEWRSLLAPVADGARGRGSMILLTSRYDKVARLPDALDPIPLKALADDECWSIIKERVFGGDSTPDNLVEIGKQIASKVRGSPLAAKAVAGMLRDNRDDDVHWRRILVTDLGDLADVKDVLKRSYWHLPSDLRKCFAYCSLFPKGHKFDPDRIGCMWVALGFIRPRPQETMEEAGRRCFNDLSSRSFFQTHPYTDYYIMHDLIHDLARNVSSGDCLRFEGGGGDSINLSQDNIIPETVRHIHVTGTAHLAELFNKGCKFVNLRSFLFDRDYSEEFNVEVLVKVLKQLRRVRVLVLDGAEVKELPPPDVVGDWIHLRFLDISGTRIVRLPESSRLYHLQVLSVGRKWEFREEFMNNLIKLRILHVPAASGNFFSIRDAPTNFKVTFIGRLTSLEALNGKLCIGRERGYQIEQLKDLNGLRGSLDIEGLQNVGSGRDAEGANLRGKICLSKLSLEWGRQRRDPLPGVEEEVLKALQPPSNLKRLEIRNYGGSTCPSWMCNQWLPNLNSIILQGLTGLVRFPPLGQLRFLETLCIWDLSAVRKLSGHEFYGTGDVERFPSLRELDIRGMPELEQWWSVPDDGQWFPRLQKLSFYNCPKLRSLPPLGQLPFLETLYIQNLCAVRKLSGHEFYGTGDVERFPSLRKLDIREMPELEQWWPVPDDGQWFPRLQKLEIGNCPKLRSLPPLEQLPSLRVLEMKGLNAIIKLGHEVSITDVAGSTISSHLESLRIDDLMLLTTVPILKTVRHSLQQVSIFSKTITITKKIIRRKRVSMSDAFQGTSFPLEFEKLLLRNCTTLQTIELGRTPSLKSLPASLRCLSSLKTLKLHDAQELQSLPDLPNSLELLYINNAHTELKRRYQRDVGPDWHKIQHIKRIKFLYKRKRLMRRPVKEIITVV